MRNPITNSIPVLVEKTGVIVAGLTEHGEALGLVRHTGTSVNQKLTNVITAINGYTQAKAAQRTSKTALRTACVTARQFAMSVRDSLKPMLGNVHSVAWAEVGFNDALAVSFDPATLNMLMLAIKDYLTRNPTAENAQSNFTAARAEILSNELTAGIDAVAVANYNVASTLRSRSSAMLTLKRAIRGVISELSEAIDPLSDYWLRFGFNKPGAKETPEIPEKVVAVVSGNAAALEWPDAPRARHYRVWRKIVGVDQEMVAIGSPTDSDFTAEDLPGNATIEFAISAVNDGGESRLSEPVTVITQ